uniref:Uncharacterized protein AlNc14C144G7339 n=1 Tax=Albugo laibachii Nc14 TaxID=890382 RepID=F0WLF1_9STRA|nr:conserved hypothetical protein [Albugo laibachii Nc14]CCA23394.1 conserved hypothetical protein [Albugo laibachii Nc14]|eukprot:CCA23394.1 conserved hypothetical protein [Albugo laibachii Nc14]
MVDEKATFIHNFEKSNLLRENSGDSNLSDVHSPTLVDRNLPVALGTEVPKERIAQESEQPTSTAAEPIQYNPTESIQANHTCVKRHVLATSSLSKTQRSTVKKACKALGSDLEHGLHQQDESTFDSSLVTHLITTSKSESLTTSQKYRRCKRTAKYMLAMAHGIFIVDFSWILASLAAAQWIDEEKYEVDGDIHTEVMGKPRESRLNRIQTGRSSDIFSLFRFVLLFRLEDYEYHVDSLRAVVFAFEGRMLPEDQLPALETSENATRTCVGIVPRGTPAESAREKYHQYHIPIVQIAWIVDCISHLEILPFGEYFPY